MAIIVKSRWPAFILGLILGAAIWLLSPFITGRREPWDAEGNYYAGALLAAGALAGIIVPAYWGTTVLGIFVGQVLVLLGGVLADPSSGGLWPLGVLLLGAYSVLALLGAAIVKGVRQVRSRFS
jgi:hypothetical protein